MRLRNPFRSEAEAFKFTIASAIGAAIVVGAALVDVWLGVAVAIAVVVLLGLGFLREPVPGLAEPQPRISSGTPPGRHRVLVVAPPGTTRPPQIAEGSEVLVVVPAVASKLEAVTGAVDDRRAEARETAERLGAALSARAEVGADDPVLAVEDSLRAFGADEVVVVGGDGLAERIRERVTLPVSRAQ